MSYPYVSPAVGLCQVEGGYLAYDVSTKFLHELNPVAALIVELADGTRSLEEISALIAPLVPGNDPAATVGAFVAEGLASGLLVSGDDGASHPARFLTADEVRDAGSECWELDRSEAALKLAQRWVELKPEDSLAWYALGDRAQWLERIPLAVEAYKRYLDFDPGNDAVRQILAGLEGGPPPPRCSDHCIELIFEAFASSYDEQMRGALRYEAPERIEEMLAAYLDGRADLEVLDLGCGTGLMGALLRRRARRLTGVDLSAAMSEQARALSVYDAIELAEIHAWLESPGACFDLIVSTDCLVYVGDLARVTRLAFARLKPGGWFAYSVEKGEHYPLQLKPTGRYTHHRNHLVETAAAAGLNLIDLKEGFLRSEGGKEVVGWIALLRKPDSG
ncbi:MAG TPA: methyltransferase domain-containing protein [Terracidiphilus sp.]|nr:methyltransferase domain-containing protein [Terracidiphilus sp.]